MIILFAHQLGHVTEAAEAPPAGGGGDRSILTKYFVFIIAVLGAGVQWNYH